MLDTLRPANLNFVTDRLAIGDIASRYIPGWTGIITCCSDEQIQEAGFKPDLLDVWVLKIPFPDGEVPDNMEEMLVSARATIAQGLGEGGHVLVHCGAGLSRSPFVVIDYLMTVAGMTPSEALAFVHRSHVGASPAEVFLRYLTKIHRVEERSGSGPRVLRPEDHEKEEKEFKKAETDRGYADGYEARGCSPTSLYYIEGYASGELAADRAGKLSAP